MTVCIASFCRAPKDGVYILGASDRMISMNGLEFEGENTKLIANFGNTGTWIMLAGVLDDLEPVVNKVGRVIVSEGISDIREMADMLANQYREEWKRAKEEELLRPKGIYLADLAAGKTDLPENVVIDYLGQMSSRYLPLSRRDFGGQMLLCGGDSSGAHIYFITQFGRAESRDWSGYWAIGSGAAPALDYLMSVKYARTMAFSNALMHIYIAKKKSEAARGVGTYTDLLYAGAHGAFLFNPEASKAFKGIEDAYKAMSKASDEAFAAGSMVVNQLLEEESAAQEIPKQDVAPPTTTDDQPKQ